MTWGGGCQLNSSRQPSTHIPQIGESNTVVSPTVPGGLSDGQWHTVHLRYYNKVGTTLGLGVWGKLGCQVLPLRGHPEVLLSGVPGSPAPDRCPGGCSGPLQGQGGCAERGRL